MCSAFVVAHLLRTYGEYDPAFFLHFKATSGLEEKCQFKIKKKKRKLLKWRTAKKTNMKKKHLPEYKKKKTHTHTTTRKKKQENN